MLNRNHEISTQVLSKPEEFSEVEKFYRVSGENPNLTKEVLFYEYIANPDQYGNFIYAKSQADIIGSIGSIGFNMIKNGEKQHSIMLERALVSRLFWGQHILEKLEKKTFDLASAQKDINFFWGITSIPSPFVRLGYSAHNCLSRYLLKNIQDKRFDHQTYQVKYGFSNEISQHIINNSKKYPLMYFLSYTLNKYLWLIEENTFIKRNIIRIYHKQKFIGFSIVRNISPSMLAIDDLQVTHVQYIFDVMAALIGIAQQNAYSIISFVMNQENLLLQQLIAPLKAIGFIPEAYNNAQLIIKPIRKMNINPDQLHLSGTWAPPYWAAPSC